MKLVVCIYCDLLVELHGDTEHEHGFSMKWHFERECQRHPMRKMEVDISALRATLDEERTSVLFWRSRYLEVVRRRRLEDIQAAQASGLPVSASPQEKPSVSIPTVQAKEAAPSAQYRWEKTEEKVKPRKRGKKR